MSVSVIIPNWNGLAHLPRCLASLGGQIYSDFEIIVVDNGSTDGSREWLAREHPEARLIALERNYGFAGACNAGLRTGRGEILVLLNNDTEACPRWLEEIVSAFERHPDAGLVASKMLLFDRRDTLHAAGDFYRADGTPGNRGVWQKDGPEFDEECYVFSACGGTAAYRRAMIQEIGPLDEEFYYSCEDVDLGWRAQLAGWRCLYAPRAVVYHKLSATGGGPTASYYDGRNFIYVLVKDVPEAVWRRHWREIAATQLRLAWEALRAALRGGAAARARLRGQLAGLAAIPALLRKRHAVQATRRVSEEYIESVLTEE